MKILYRFFNADGLIVTVFYSLILFFLSFILNIYFFYFGNKG